MRKIYDENSTKVKPPGENIKEIIISGNRPTGVKISEKKSTELNGEFSIRASVFNWFSKCFSAKGGINNWREESNIVTATGHNTICTGHQHKLILRGNNSTAEGEKYNGGR